MFRSAKSCTALYIFIMILSGSSFLFSKVLLSDMGPFNLLGIRFLIGFVVLFFVFFRKMIRMTKKDFLYGVIIGVVYFAVMALELNALEYSTPSMTSFLEHTAIVMVPIFESVITKSLPQLKVIICDIITLIGIGFLSLTGDDGFSLQIGEILCLITAVVYAVAIILTTRLSAKSEPISVGIIQIGVMGVIAMVISFFVEEPHLPQTGQQWLFLMILALLCTGVGFAMRPLSQSHMTCQMTGTLAAVNPLAATILSVIFLGEVLTISGIIGSILIIAGIILIYLLPDKKRKC